MPSIGPTELILILVIGLLIMGPGKLAESGKALGSAVRDFRKAVDGKDEPPAA